MYTEFKKGKFLQTSRLSPAQKTRGKEIFMRVAQTYADDGYNYRLRLHRYTFAEREKNEKEWNIANAFALPDGLVVATDRLFDLLTDDEIAAVFAHEIGHVKARHGMRMLLQSAGIFAFLTLASGDASGLLTGAAVLLNLKYSRDHEHEADCFAYHYLRRHDMPVNIIGNALTKMEQDFSPPPLLASGNTSNDEKKHEDHADWEKLLEVLSTHPATNARFNLVACDLFPN